IGRLIRGRCGDAADGSLGVGAIARAVAIDRRLHTFDGAGGAGRGARPGRVVAAVLIGALAVQALRRVATHEPGLAGRVDAFAARAEVTALLRLPLPVGIADLDGWLGGIIAAARRVRRADRAAAVHAHRRGSVTILRHPRAIGANASGVGGRAIHRAL